MNQKRDTLLVFQMSHLVVDTRGDSWIELAVWLDGEIEDRGHSWPPPGWYEDGSDPRRPVLSDMPINLDLRMWANAREPKRYRGKCLSSEKFEGYDIWEVATVPVSGPCQLRRKGDTITADRDAVRIMSDGTVVRLSRYYGVETLRLNGEGDYCYYCGTWNGLDGELRMGWDCCACGSN